MLGFRVRTGLGAIAGSCVAAMTFAGAATAADQVNVRFSWKMKGEYAPYFTALEKGYFKRENLEVRLGEGAGSQAALGALIQGQEDIVVLPGIFALTAIQKGLPVKLIALYHPKTPVTLITFPDKPAHTPKDLEGKTVAHSVGETGTSYLDAFLKLNGVDPSKVKRAMMAAQARVPAFIQRQVDVVSVYQTNDLPIMLEKEKTPFVIMDMVKFGLAVPGMALVTSDAHIAKKPDVLRRFASAVADAIRDAQKDVQGATVATRKNWANPPSETAVFQQIRATVEAIPVPADHQVGWIDQKVIADALALLHSVNEIETPKPVETYFTNALLTK
jgi:NitT/TauT family transport system substrate-binding protein